MFTVAGTTVVSALMDGDTPFGTLVGMVVDGIVLLVNWLCNTMPTVMIGGDGPDTVLRLIPSLMAVSRPRLRRK